MNSLLFLLVVPGEPCSVGGWPRGRMHITHPCFIMLRIPLSMPPTWKISRVSRAQKQTSLKTNVWVQIGPASFLWFASSCLGQPMFKGKELEKGMSTRSQVHRGPLDIPEFFPFSYSTISLAVSLIVCFKVHAESSYHLYWYHLDHLFACIITIGSSLTSLLPFFLQQSVVHWNPK